MLNEIHVFDMDGTLVDSHDVTIEAYQRASRAVGISLPANWWGRSAQEWQCPPALHAQKLLEYSLLAYKVQPAWAAPTFLDVVGREGSAVSIWTAASADTVHILKQVAHLAPLLEGGVRSGMRLKDKRDAFIGLRALFAGAKLFYYDDDVMAGRYITNKVQNAVLHTKGARAVCV